MADFRNIIVFDHADIEPEVVVGLLRKHVEDLMCFSREILLSTLVARKT